MSTFVKSLLEAPAPLTIGAFFVVWVLMWLPLAIPLAIVLQWRPPNVPTVAQKIPLVLSLYAIAPLLLWWTAHLTGASFSQYGFTPTVSLLTSLAAGLGLGVLGVVLLFGLETGLGWIAWQPSWNQLASALPPILLLALVVSAVEELVFRGFVLNQLQYDYPLGIAAIASSVIFAVLHLVWEGPQGIPQLPGLWLMGMVLVLARWVDGGSLGLACGLHAGWVWAMASIDTAQLMRYTDRGPAWMTGLAGQPLAGVVGLLLLLVTAGVLWGASLA